MLGVHIGAGLCNRIFQMVFAYSFAKRYGINFRFESWNIRNHHSNQIYEWLVQRFMDLPNYEKLAVSYDAEYKEPPMCFTHCLDVMQSIPMVLSQNILASGFFQNENYFLDYKEDIQYLLREPEHVSEFIQQNLSSYIHVFQEAYFLHIRLGDYIYLEKHWIDLEKYYLTALTQIYTNNPNAWIIVFCNFPEEISQKYAKVMEYLKNKQFLIVTDQDEVRNFYLMIRCKKGGICSNSTFGWWASWLNTNWEKKVYMPNRWINSTEEIRIYPSWAIRLDVA
jgi:hypothetical protein